MFPVRRPTSPTAVAGCEDAAWLWNLFLAFVPWLSRPRLLQLIHVFIYLTAVRSRDVFLSIGV